MRVFMRTCAGRAVAASLAISLGVSGTFAAMAAKSEPLTLQAKIPLGDVKGRIDHLATRSHEATPICGGARQQ